jgi:diguanylate cyclase (GGDEF)-like protein
MNSADAPIVLVIVSAGDVARVEDFFRRESFPECRLIIQPPGVAAHVPQNVATLLLRADNSREVLYQTADLALTTSCSEDELGSAVRLLAKIADLRGSLAHAEKERGQLRELAALDPLTNLPNRRTWDEELARLCEDCSRRGESLGLIILDLDRFKEVNDRHGHAVGDDVLRATADGLRRAVRRGDLAARLGGDEFGVLLPGLKSDTVATVVERIRASIQDAQTAAGVPPTTCSIGHAVGPVPPTVLEVASSNTAGTTGPTALYATACEALRQAKLAPRKRPTS